jgi:pimeloyl-ACP methyl ester carboxylesterase
MRKFFIGFTIAGLVLIAMAIVVTSQTLPRKAMLGVSAQAVDEAKAKEMNVKAGEGLLVSAVTPNGTFDEIGVKVGDVILSINGKSVNSPAALVAMAQSMNEGNLVEVDINSNGVKSVKRGPAKGKPKEISEVSDVVYDATEMSLGKLRTITYVPKNKTGKLPAVFYIQGLPCQSQELADRDPRKQAFEDWVKAGFVVFRVERPNLGDSVTTKDCRDIDFNEEIETNRAGYKKLLSYDFVDSDNIFFFGHSMGGWTAPIIAQMKQPKGIIVYGTGMVSWFEYFIHLFRIQSTLGGGTHVEAERETRKMIPFLYEWLEAGKSMEEIRKNPALKAIADEPGMFEGEYFQGRAFGRSAHYFYTMSKQNLAEAWSKTKCRVLAMYGEFDVQALNADDAITIAEVVNQANPGKGEFLLLPKTEHIFARSESYKQTDDLYKSGKFFQYAAQNYNPEFGRVTSEWMTKAMKP